MTEASTPSPDEHPSNVPRLPSRDDDRPEMQPMPAGAGRRRKRSRKSGEASAGSSPSFAAALLLASLQHRDGLFAGAASHAGAASDGRHDLAGPERHLPPHLAGGRRRRRTAARVGPDPFPFLPDYGNDRCKNDRSADAWTTDPPLTAEDCCARHFSWIAAGCEEATREWLAEEAGGGAREGGGGATGYYYDATDGTCKPDGEDRPTWIADVDVYDDHEECCGRSWDKAECMDEADGGPEEEEEIVVADDPAPLPVTRAPTPSPTPSPTKRQWYYDAGDGTCKPDGKKRPDWISEMYDDLEECCDNSWNVSVCMDEVSQTLGEDDGGNDGADESSINDGDAPVCADFTKEACAARSSECTWQTNGLCVSLSDSNISANESGTSSSSITNGEGTTILIAESTTDQCNLLTRKQCTRNEPFCAWVKDPHGADFCVSPASAIDEGPLQSCTRHGKEDCADAVGCQFHKKMGCVAGPVDCALLERVACDAHSDDCAWHKKSGCMASVDSADSSLVVVPEPTRSPTSSPTRRPIPDPTARPTTRSPTPGPTERWWYYDAGDGMCKPEGKKRPDYIFDLYDDHEECCDNSWDKAVCMDEVEKGSEEEEDGGNEIEFDVVPPSCVDFTREACDAHSEECTWHKKTGCSPLSDSDNSAAANNPDPTPNPTTRSPTPSHTKNLWYYESRDGMCKLDGKKRPDWIFEFYDDHEECCDNSWDNAKCVEEVRGVIEDNGGDVEAMNDGGQDSSVICYDLTREPCAAHSDRCAWQKRRGCLPLSDADISINDGPGPTRPPTHLPTPSPTEWWWYYDTGDGMCKPHGEDRPEWMSELYEDHEECCSNSWDKAKCVEKVEEMLMDEEDEAVNDSGQNFAPDCANLKRAECAASSDRCAWQKRQGCQPLPGSENPANDTPDNPDLVPGPTYSPTERRWYYYDSGDGMCKADGKKRPDWLTSLHDDFEECCAESWKESSCLLSEDNPDKGGKDLGDGGSRTPILIELTAYGSVDLQMNSVPSQVSNEWNRLKRALTKTIVLIMAGSDRVQSDFMEVELWSIGGESFTWRRGRRLNENEWQDDRDVEQNAQVDVFDSHENAEGPIPSSLRGSKVVLPQQRRLEVHELKFGLTVLTRCDRTCQTDTLVAKGTAPFDAIDDYFQNAVSSGLFTVTLAKEGNAMGLFQDGAPSASSGELTYKRAQESTKELTWSPSTKPTAGVTSAPTVDVYYPDTENAVCKSGDGHLSSNVYFYGTIEKCCQHPWMENYKECVRNSDAANRPTYRPAGQPTHKPTKTGRPTRRPKTNRPTKRPPEPTKSSLEGPSPNMPIPPTNPVGVVYYPDLDMGVCKFDGQHGSIPYQFSTAAACCTNQWMDHDKCMAYADPYYFPEQTKYYPDVYGGYCKSDGGHVGVSDNLVYDSAEECCSNVWMVFAYCLVHSISGTPPSAMVPNPSAPGPPSDPGPSPMVLTTTAPDRTPLATPHLTLDPTTDPTLYPTPKPTFQNNIDPGELTGEFYPDLNAGLCRADGKQFGNVYLFDTLEECCTNNVLDYHDCVTFSLERFSQDGLQLNLCRWHPDPTKFGTCTYSSTYPKGWAAPDKKDKYLFDDHRVCCMGVFGGAGCKQDYDCNGAKAGPTPTGDVTEAPTTYIPTWNPTTTTGSPTKLATATPTVAPTARPTNRVPDPTPQPTNRPRPSPPSNPAPSVGDPKPFTVPPVVTTAIDATSIARELSDGFENGLTGGFPWHTTPDLPWTTYDQDSTEGSYSARSHVVGPGQNSDLHVAIKSQHGGVLYFDFKTDVQMPFSGCYINVDGESVKGYTFPKPEWIPTTLEILQGDHVVMFRAWAPRLGKTMQSSVSGTIGLDNVSYMPHVYEGFESGSLKIPGVTFSGGITWDFDTTQAKSGSFSMRSPDRSAFARMEFTAPRRGSDISFWYLPGIAANDRFSFAIDGVDILKIPSPSATWKRFTKMIRPGKHILEWKYEKNGNAPGGVWLDEIEIKAKS